MGVVSVLSCSQFLVTGTGIRKFLIVMTPSSRREIDKYLEGACEERDISMHKEMN